MMIYLTRMSYGHTAADLRDADLNACLNRGLKLFDILTGAEEPGDYKGSPVLGMWRGYEYALGVYVLMGGMEWCFRKGFAGHPSFFQVYKGIKEVKKEEPDWSYDAPPWFRDKDVLASHRSNLARRDPLTYGEKWNVVPSDWPYLWPIIDSAYPEGYRLMLSKADKKHLRNGTRILPATQKARVVNWP